MNFPPPQRCVLPRVLGGLLATMLLGAGCGVGAAPDVPEAPDGTVDTELVAGREVWQANCARCHGGSGGGGTGTKLNDGAVLAAYPDIADQIDLVVNGRNGMPEFGDRLDDAQIAAVVRYSREVLAVTGSS